MTLTEILRFSQRKVHRPGDEAVGRLRYGIYNCLLTGYVKATGFTLDAAAFGLVNIKAVFVQPVDCAGLWLFDWDPATGIMTILDVSDGAEIESDEADGDNVLLMYYGF